MALPQLRVDGSLPPGEHRIHAVSDVFVAFPATTHKRQELNTALNYFVDVVKRRSLGVLVVIDGSYITGKAEPEDIDVALLSAGASETATLAARVTAVNFGWC